MTRTYYLTTAIDYGNAAPHIGHAYEKICADCTARWRRMAGDDVFFLTGTDENAQKVYKAAAERGDDPKTFVDGTSQRFQDLCEALDITNDRFIRTTDPHHAEAAQRAFQTVWDKGEMYKAHYEGLYCTGCEAFYSPEDLQDGLCPTHRRKCDLIKEENYFFRMSEYRDRLLEHYERHPDFIIPTYRTNEALNRVKDGLQDLSVSRPTLDWGIPVPTDGTHVIYVWFDALVNYLSGIGYPGNDYRRYWPADAHFIGKDILWFHAVIWPCMLMAMDLPVPKHIFVHGFWDSRGSKMSKSTGNVVDPFELIEAYGVDTLRYFLLRETPFGQDGNFTMDGLLARRNTELGNELGNLLQRTLGMLKKYRDSVVPRPGESGGADPSVLETVETTIPALAGAMGIADFSVALGEVWKLVRRANRYVEESEPWVLAKKADQGRLDTVLYNLCECLRLLSILLEPFIPTTALAIGKQLGLSERKGLFEHESRWGLLPPGTRATAGEPLFPRIDT